MVTLTQRHEPGRARAAGADAYPGLIDRLDAVDIARYPLAGLLRPVYAMFVNDDDERMRGYLDQARACPDEWLAAAGWLMAASAGGKRREARRDAALPPPRRWTGSARSANGGGCRPRCGPSATSGCSTATWTAPPPRTPRPASCSRSWGTARTCPRSSSSSPRSPPGRATWPGPASCPRPPGRPRSRTDRPSTGASPRPWWAAFEVTWGDIEAARPLHADAERLLARLGPAHPARDHLEAMVAATGTLIAIADADLRAAREQAARSYRAAVAAAGHAAARAGAGALAELAFALGQPERAAEMLGASDRGARRRRPHRPDGGEAGYPGCSPPSATTATTAAVRRGQGARPGRGDRAPRPGQAGLIKAG